MTRLEVPDGDTLGRLAAEALEPRASDRDLILFRDVHYDTPAGDLAARGSVVRIRHHQDGRRLLLVDVREVDAGEPVSRHHAEAEFEGLDDTAAFRGDSEPGRLLRSMIDPSRLEIAFEIETHRRFGVVDADDGDRVELSFDTLVVRRDQLSGTLWEIRVVSGSGEAAERHVARFEKVDGVRITLTEPARRARELLDDAEVAALEREVQSAREVAVLAAWNGRLGLISTEEGLRVPCGEGSGAAAARRVLARNLSEQVPRLRLLGTSAGGPTRPALEVWLTEDLSPEAAADAVVWIAIPELIDAVVRGGLREARTLAAVEIACRSDLSPEGGPGGILEGDRFAPGPLELSLPPSPRMTRETDDLDPANLLNAELSRIAFDERILAFAEGDDVPLLEQVRFLSMFGARQDDFFMTRVAGFKEELGAGGRRRTMDGLSAHEQLDLIALRTRQVARRAQRLYRTRLAPALEQRGVELLRWSQLEEREQELLLERFAPDAEAVLTPMVTDASHPFPHIRNLRPAIAALVRFPEAERSHFLALELPGELPRFLRVPDTQRFVPLEELLIAHLPRLAAGMRVVAAHVFRVTRSARSDVEETLVGDVLQAVEDDIAGRPFGAPVRLEVDAAMPPALRHYLLRELRHESMAELSPLSQRDVYAVDGLIDLAALEELVELPIEGGRFEPLERTDALDPERPVMALVRERDRLVYFPHDRFESSAERFLREAAEDPDVVSVKVTLYRTDSSSEMVRALARARELGKDATALIEIKASFDEQRNIAWAKSLSAAGIHVALSPLRYKVHAKAALVVRREDEKLVRYAYIGTGNLNNATARSYTDAGLFTADPEITAELQAVFNILTGYSAPAEFKHLLVSPFNMRDRYLELIDREIEHVRAGRGGRIRGQLNGLADRRLVAALYEASQAGVEIDLAVREICVLRPGVPGLSENIRIVSLVGRLLQHARIFEFANGGETEYYIGSADWRPRNLTRRVEVAVPVRDPGHQQRLAGILDDLLHDPRVWELQPDGSHVRDSEVVGSAAAVRAVAG